MHKTTWVKAVYKSRISPGKSRCLYTPPTDWLLNILHETFFVPSLGAVFARQVRIFTQAKFTNFYLMGGWFYSFSTMPNEATKIYLKD